MKPKTILTFIAIISFVACTYYEQGPAFSFKTAKTRISGEWELSDVIINDNTDEIILKNENQITYTFIEDGSIIINNIDNTRSTPKVINGSWEFNKDKTTIKINLIESNPTLQFIVDNEVKIIKLTNNEFWISDENSTTRENDFITERRYTKVVNE